MLLIGAAASAGASVFVLAGIGVPGPAASMSSHVGRLVRRVVRGSVLLGRLRSVAWVSGHAPVRELADELAHSLAPYGIALDTRPAVAVLLCCLAAITLGAGALFASPVAGVASGAVVAGSLLGRELARRQRRRREVADAMPGIYRTLSVALGSGQTLAQAVDYVGSHERGPAAGVFARMSLRLRCGVSTEDAVGLLARELKTPGAGLLATALVISHRTGSPLRELLMRSAALAERQGEFERLLSVKTAQVRLSVRIVCLLPAVMIAVLALISPDFQEGLLTPTGLGCVALAALLDGVALLIIRRFLRGVL
ncbi:type II secretion system F family protein [Olsenella profusa]|uniref:Type II secretion system F family protein n=2 Tax=Olsenella profusa TaxID=138595 RepID=A0ABS2F176_9ACTN|nr:type II secretion system F family protein [Olsenella profusa]